MALSRKQPGPPADLLPGCNALDTMIAMCAPKTLLSVSLQSSPDAVRDVLARVAQTVAAAGQNPTATNNIELAMAEALNNVVEHSFHETAKGRILVEITLDEDVFCISIRHDGTPMPGMRLPEGRPANVGVDSANLPEGGFGWFLIRSLVLDAAYTHRDNWSELVLRFARLPEG